MLFTVLHLLAIVSVMAGSFVAGFWYANNTYIRGKKIKASIKREPVQYELFDGDILPAQLTEHIRGKRV